MRERIDRRELAHLFKVRYINQAGGYERVYKWCECGKYIGYTNCVMDVTPGDVMKNNFWCSLECREKIQGGDKMEKKKLTVGEMTFWQLCWRVLLTMFIVGWVIPGVFFIMLLAAGVGIANAEPVPLGHAVTNTYDGDLNINLIFTDEEVAETCKFFVAETHKVVTIPFDYAGILLKKRLYVGGCRVEGVKVTTWVYGHDLKAYLHMYAYQTKDGVKAYLFNPYRGHYEEITVEDMANI